MYNCVDAVVTSEVCVHERAVTARPGVRDQVNRQHESSLVTAHHGMWTHPSLNTGTLGVSVESSDEAVKRMDGYSLNTEV
jgi:hypothetical protein